MKIFEFKTSQKQKHQLKAQKATHHVKASNETEATRMLKTRLKNLGQTSTNIQSCKELSNSEAKNISPAKLITPENYNRWQQPGSQTKKPASKNDVDWQTIDQLSHNREVDGFTDEENELTENL